jgi:predicted RecB family nuclease
LTPDQEARLFLEFWHWLTELRAVAAGSGLRARAYCYNETAEDTQMRRLATTVGLRAEVEMLIGSDDWVDLRKVFEDQLVTGSSVGLKHVAPLSGFKWEVDDPGGDISMLYYETAVGSSELDVAAAARSWLLTYNRNDGEATAALRQWLETSASACPSIESQEG